jgi:hypothetical protein
MPGLEGDHIILVRDEGTPLHSDKMRDLSVEPRQVPNLDKLGAIRAR